MKHITAYLTSQARIYQKPNKQAVYRLDTEPVSQVKENPEKFFQNLPRHYRKAFDYLCMLSNNFFTIFPSYKQIAYMAGIGVTETKQVMKDLVLWGVIAKNYLHRRSCRYVISSWFKNPHIRMRLSNWITAFKWLPRTMLILFRGCDNPARRKTCQCEYCLPYIIDIKFKQQQSSRSVIERLTLERKKGAPLMFNPISEPIRNIKSLKLTKWGQIKLMAFPNKAIEYADDKMKYSNLASLRDPFRFFTSLCVDYCKREEIEPNWEIVYQLETAYKPPEGAKYLFSVNEPDKLEKKESHQGGKSDTQPSNNKPLSAMDKLNHWLEVLNQSLPGSRGRSEARAHISIHRQLYGTRDIPSHPDVLSPSNRRNDVTDNEVSNPFRTGTVEASGTQPSSEGDLRSTEERQADLWDRVRPAARHST